MATILTPIMTSNTLPIGEVIASSTQAESYPYYAFNQNTENSWVADSTESGEWIQYNFEVGKLVNLIDFYDGGSLPLQISVKASNDGEEWTNLGTFTEFTEGKTALDLSENKTRFLSYRIIFDELAVGQSANASRIDLIYNKKELKYFSQANINYLLTELSDRIKESHMGE